MIKNLGAQTNLIGRHGRGSVLTKTGSLIGAELRQEILHHPDFGTERSRRGQEEAFGSGSPEIFLRKVHFEEDQCRKR